MQASQVAIDTVSATPRPSVSEVVAARRSVRAFLDRPVDLALLRDLLERAARAPSGGNLQPWHIHVVSGVARDRLVAIMAARIADRPKGETAEFPIYPPVLDDPYAGRRHAVGEALYGHLAIARDDPAGRRGWFAGNYRFFGAPVGLFCSVDRRMDRPQWSDLGMFLQSLMLLLVERGLASCAQECWAMYSETVGRFLDLPAERMLFTGMAIGYEDVDAPANRLRSHRAPLHEFATFHDR